MSCCKFNIENINYENNFLNLFNNDSNFDPVTSYPSSPNSSDSTASNRLSDKIQKISEFKK